MMVPYDGQGYGRSMNWHYYALKSAKKVEEICDHMNINTVLITIAPITDGLGTSIKFKVTCRECEKSFSNTSHKLTRKFLKFYGLNKE